MGTDVQIAVHPRACHSESMVEQILDKVVRMVHEMEQRMSRFHPTSDICQINQGAGRWVEIHPATFEVLRLAREAFIWTDGLFNPCLGAVLEHIGYDVSFDRRREPDEAPLVHVHPIVSSQCPYELSSDGRHCRVHPGFQVDVGGIGKGWIVEQCTRVLRDSGFIDFVVNAGGDAVCGGRNGERPWLVGIEDPFSSTQHVLTLTLDSLSLATSGTYKRRWTHQDKTVHHLIDPRTGRPSTSDIVSCTVVHPSLVAAEVMAKTCLLLGSVEGIEWLSSRVQRGWVVVKNTGEVIHAWNS